MTSAWNALVLNANHMPVTNFPLSVWSFEKTLSNVLRDRVSVLETYEVELHSMKLTYRPPSVVALKTYVHTPQHVPFTRMNVFLRDRFCCGYCGERFEARDLTFDHVIPRADGGGTSWTNILSACCACNSRKGRRRDIKPLRSPWEPTPREMLARQHLKPASFPRSWADHLYWSGVLQKD